MFEIATYISYVLVLVILNWIDYRIYKTIINPIFCLSVPFSIVLIVCLLFNQHMGFIPFYSPSLWLWTVGLCLFWVGGHFITIAHRKITVRKKRRYVSGKLIHIIFLGCIFFMIAKILSNGSDLMIGSKDMGEEVSIGGLTGRVANILMIAFPFYIYYRVNKYVKLVLLVLLFSFLITLGTKTWLMSTILAAIIVFISMKRTKINIKLLVSTVFILLVLFLLYYYLLLFDKMGDLGRIMEFVSRHFYFYLTSGILPMGEYVKFHDFNEYNSLYHPVMGIIKSWMGYDVESHSRFWITTDLYLGTQSNVYTFFGTFYLLGTIHTFMFYSLIYGIWCYMIYEIHRVCNNIFPTIANAFNLAILFFGWYNCGLALFRIWEIVILIYGLYYVYKKTSHYIDI